MYECSNLKIIRSLWVVDTVFVKCSMITYITLSSRYPARLQQYLANLYLYLVAPYVHAVGMVTTAGHVNIL